MEMRTWVGAKEVSVGPARTLRWSCEAVARPEEVRCEKEAGGGGS